MITTDNKVYRNLEEQVLKNQKDIEGLKFGLNIDGHVANVPDLPQKSPVGACYLVGEHSPYYFYVKTSNEPSTYVNVGTLASQVPGPMGPMGETGPAGIGIASIETNVNGDTIIHFSNGSYQNLGDLRGGMGPRGYKGDMGLRGPKGDMGPKGEQGESGTSFEIIAILDSTNDLPVPPMKPTDAYLVKTDTKYNDLYVWVGRDNVSGTWKNQGNVLITDKEVQDLHNEVNTLKLDIIRRPIYFRAIQTQEHPEQNDLDLITYRNFAGCSLINVENPIHTPEDWTPVGTTKGVVELFSDPFSEWFIQRVSLTDTSKMAVYQRYTKDSGQSYSPWIKITY